MKYLRYILVVFVFLLLIGETRAVEGIELSASMDEQPSARIALAELEDATPVGTTAEPTAELPSAKVLPSDGAVPPAVPQAIPPGDPDVTSIIYRFFDWGNDWQTLHPEYGPIGSIHFYMWEDVNPSPGVYDWSVIDREMAKERSLKVTMLDGQEVAKPVVLQVFPYISSAWDWEGAYFYDGTPEWVYDQIDLENPSDPRPIVNDRKVGYRLEGCNAQAVLPKYDSMTWQNAYYDMVRAFGARYNSDPQVSAIVINTGLDGETQLTKDFGCNWETLVDTTLPGGVRYRFGQYMLASMDVYREAFPDKAIFINNAPGGSGTRKATSDYAATFDPPIGLKHSGMWVDLDSHQGYGTFTGSWDMIREYSTTLPIWLESPYGFGSAENDYWALVAGLHYHPDAIDLHPDFLTVTDPEMLRWVSAHLGKSIDEAPSVWTVLRDSEYPLVSWTTGGVSGHVGDWSYWLYHKEVPGGETVRVWREELPVAARSYLYSRQARRTDEVRGQQYIYFDVDDDYPYVGQKAVAEPGGNVSYVLRMMFLNQGNDTISLQYENYAGQLVSKTLQKGTALGPVNSWIDYSWSLDDAYLANVMTGGTDFCISSNGDGDEVVHLVELTGIWGQPPTVTPTPSITPTPSKTPTPSNTPTPTNTHTPTYTPTPTSTSTPLSGAAAVVADTGILATLPEQTNGSGPTLTVSGNGEQRALIRFDLSGLPQGSGVAEATLRLYGLSDSGAPMSIYAYGLLREWSEQEASWQWLDALHAWAAPGADSPGVDRESAAASVTLVTGGEGWTTWDVTDLVNSWLKLGQTNAGILLVGQNAGSLSYDFSAREGVSPGQLAIRYRLPSPTPTFTPSLTPSPTPTEGPTMTPTPTLAPTPTLLPAGNLYHPESDTHISEWYTNDNFDLERRLVVRQGDISTALFRFNLDNIPADTVIHQATLNLWVYRRSNTGNMYLNAFKVRRPWVGAEATWSKASASASWAQAGCNGLGTDRDSAKADMIELRDENRWFSLDVTEMVRAWVADPSSNHGLIIKGEGVVSVQYEFASAEWLDAAMRPQLVVSAGDIPPTSTPTQTVPPTATLSPTATATPSRTPTQGPTPTSTMTLTPSTTPSQPASVTPTPTEVVAATPTAQPGAVRYEPLADTTLNQWGPDEILGSSPLLLVRQGDIRAPLLRFGVEDIPANVQVDKAVLHLYVDYRTNAGSLPIAVHAVNRAWREDQATWHLAQAGQNWAVAGCNASSDRDQEPVVEALLDASDTWFSLDITGLVQDWVQSPSSNQGLVIKGNGGVSVQYEFGSRESGNVLKQPWLEISYLLETATPTSSPTVTRTPMPTATPSPTTTPSPTVGPSPTVTPTFMPPPTPVVGAEVWPVTYDTYLDSWDIDASHGAEPWIIVRQGDVRVPLLYADLAAMPRSGEVLSAKLHLWILNRTNDGFLSTSVHQILRDWDVSTANWVRADLGDNWQQAGCNGIGQDRAGEAASDMLLAENRQWVSLDITELVKAWHQNPDQNRGLVIKGSGGVSVQYEFASVDHPVSSVRPWVEIVRGVPTATPTPTHTATATLPPTATPTATMTPTVTQTPIPAPTSTPSSTASATTQPELSPTPSDTPTPADTPTATPTVAPTPEVVDGGVLLTSGQDSMISAWLPQENYAHDPFIWVRQGDVIAALLAYDLADLPANARIDQAELQLYVAERSNTNSLATSIYAVGQDWNAEQATWEQASDGHAWEAMGCNGVPGDHGAEVLGQATLDAVGQWLTFDLTSIVQAWQDSPSSNHGLVLKGAIEGPSVGYALAAMDHPDEPARPRLAVRYTVIEPTPAPDSVLLSYSLPLEADAALNEWAATSNYGRSAFLPLRTLGFKRALFRFGLDDMPADAEVVRATLRVQTLSDVGPPISVGLYGLARPWDEYQANWQEAMFGQSWTESGASAQDQDLLPGVVDTVSLTGGQAWWSWDATELVRAWVGGSVPNHGLMLMSSDSDLHREYALVAKEHGQPAELVVEFSREPTYESFTLQLYAGANMVSLPVAPDSPAMSQVLAGLGDQVESVWAYDSGDAAEPWRLYVPGGQANTLAAFDLATGYWIEMASDAELTVQGQQYFGAVVPLRAGWNFVGYPGWTSREIDAALDGIAHLITNVWHYDPTGSEDLWRHWDPNAPGWVNDLAEMSPGEGYWIRVTEDCEMLVR